MVDADEPDITPLLAYLHAHRGLDLDVYKRSTVTRRIVKRLADLRIDSVADYVEYLEVHPDEHRALFDYLLINVTRFFRDPEAWDALAATVLPRITSRRDATNPLRVWSAACASGEEAYTVAMLLSEQMGSEAFSECVKIYGTDVDDAALAEARQGVFTAAQVEAIPSALRERYFERHGDRLAVSAELRRAVIFGRNDLVRDAPISRLDLLVCRNTLMYFTADTQRDILRRLHFALHEDGILFLGKAEMLLTHGNLFRPVDLGCRIFEKVPASPMRDRLLGLAQRGELGGQSPGRGLSELAFEAAPLAQLVADVDGAVVAVNRQARELFGLRSADVGRPLDELEVFYRPLELRSHLQQAYTARRDVTVHGVERRGRDTVTYLDVTITPLSSGGQPTGVALTFADVTAVKQLEQQLGRTTHELETAYEELQSSNEELETTNEELQSTVEELETTNEELQATNEELQTMNDELRVRTEEIDQVNTFLESVLTSMRIGVAVVDRSYCVQAWNDRAFDLWGLTPGEAAGRQLLELDIGLPVAGLGDPLARCDDAGEPQQVVLEATDRRGRALACQITCTRLAGDSAGFVVAMAPVEEMSSEDAPPGS